MNLELDGLAAFVGGSSRGIGYAVAERFRREGALVVITGRDQASLERAVEELRRFPGRGEVVGISGDLTVEDDIERCLEEATRRVGRLDAVVANVGDGRVQPGTNLSQSEWQAALNVNLIGSVLLATSSLRYLSGAGASVTFVSSIAGIESIGAPLPYAAAKAGILATMGELCRSAGQAGVRVNAVAPGNVLFPGGEWERKLSEAGGEIERRIEETVVLKRFGRPEEIADAVVFIASPRASFITGSCLIVDGGQTRSFY
jgi:3-oxoacyl-[acyl-carrier protein] reductase